MSEQIEASFKKVRGRSKSTLALIAAMKKIAALTAEQTGSLRSFSAESKTRDPRYKWFKQNFGDQCWELDAMDPRQLRSVVETEINALIDRELWNHQEAHEERVKKSMESLLRWWANVESLRGAASV